MNNAIEFMESFNCLLLQFLGSVFIIILFLFGISLIVVPILQFFDIL